MDNHLKAPSIFLVLCCIATIARSELLSHERNQYFASSYNPQPQDFSNEQLYRAYIVIQRFKSTITSDPKDVTATWIGHDLCGERTYVGFYCGSPPGRDKKLTVTAVILNGYNLRAPTLQGFVDQLPDLALFHAASNNFGGGIPPLPGLGYMYHLSVSNDQRLVESSLQKGGAGTSLGSNGGGDLNFDFGCVTANVHFKFKVGVSVPGGKGHSVPGVADAKALLLNHNDLSGRLPENLGLSKLSYLALANNKLTGPIPPSIGHLQDTIQEVLLLNNQLSGCLPHELGLLHKAAVIDAGKNQLTGPIPSSFSCLSSVEQLNLAENRLYGAVPDALCKLTAGPAGRLANLTLSGNYFTSVGPACAALIKDGLLDVKNNCIPGLANQRRPAECAAFQAQHKTACPAASTQVTCPAAAITNTAAAPAERKTREYSSYVTYATLHE